MNSVTRMMSPLEKKLLTKIAEMQLVTKAELANHLKADGMAGRELKDINRTIDAAAKNLIEQNFISAISPVGSTCYIITQKGSRLLNNV